MGAPSARALWRFYSNLRTLRYYAHGGGVTDIARHSRDDFAMKPIEAAIALLLAMTVLQQTARAAEWSYCVAPSDAQNRIYISKPFASVGPRAEAEFDEALQARQLPHDAVECARADDQASAIVMRQQAITVNREWGRQVIDLRWRPAP
jgi:hypothetical protein